MKNMFARADDRTERERQRIKLICMIGCANAGRFLFRQYTYFPNIANKTSVYDRQYYFMKQMTAEILDKKF